MPTIAWDLQEGGVNYKFGQELIKTSANIWAGGTQFLVTPDKEVINAGEAHELRPKLESIPVSKDKTEVVKNTLISQNSIIRLFTDTNLRFQVPQSAEYSYVVRDLQGKVLVDKVTESVVAGQIVAIDCSSFAEQVLVVTITSVLGEYSKVVMLQRN